VYSSAVFAGRSTSLVFAIKFYLDRVVPHHKEKTAHTGLPDGEDRILLRSLVLTQYRSVSDERTNRWDRWTDGFAVAYAALVRLALRRAVKTCENT